ncbi:MAG: rubredoxin [Thiotrichaceae bacterium]|nr:rubredoxin [Thiotrichaceae bacterium]
MKKWKCMLCSFIYDESEGLPEEGIAAGTAWADVPEDWICPKCGVSKGNFEMIEI